MEYTHTHPIKSTLPTLLFEARSQEQIRHVKESMQSKRRLMRIKLERRIMLSNPYEWFSFVEYICFYGFCLTFLVIIWNLHNVYLIVLHIFKARNIEAGCECKGMLVQTVYVFVCFCSSNSMNLLCVHARTFRFDFDGKKCMLSGEILHTECKRVTDKSTHTHSRKLQAEKCRFTAPKKRV